MERFTKTNAGLDATIGHTSRFSLVKLHLTMLKNLGALAFAKKLRQLSPPSYLVTKSVAERLKAITGVRLTEESTARCVR